MLKLLLYKTANLILNELDGNTLTTLIAKTRYIGDAYDHILEIWALQGASGSNKFRCFSIFRCNQFGWLRL
jgi:hypothetical protein